MPDESDPADRLLEIFDQASKMPPGLERERFVARACADDIKLREHVIALLAASERAGNFLSPASFIPGAVVAGEKVGDRIGAYTLLDRIGEGGWGVVYKARREGPLRRTVAIKVLKLGMDSRQVIARFEAERQALALMDHPNIARVLDAGATSAGRPFFVMELVRGVPITQFCDQANLSTAERLAVFVPVCHAIQHAHQKGIIHRDLKPSNVLVTLHDGKPVPKVIDFGIAKTVEQRLTDKTLFTGFGQLIGTPAYMSPEQAEMSGLDIDTRSDVYSLGVLLYELLTQTTPFDQKSMLETGFDEMRRIIREVEAMRPSTRLMRTLGPPIPIFAEAPVPAKPATRRPDGELKDVVQRLRGDLDWVILKCLEKDRERRYATAVGLANDVDRHLNHEPVLASPPTAVYRLRKLFRRHRTPILAGALVLLALVGGLVASTWSVLRARRAERAAELSRRAGAKQLWVALVAQASALRLAGQPGRRFESLEILQRAPQSCS